MMISRKLARRARLMEAAMKPIADISAPSAEAIIDRVFPETELMPASELITREEPAPVDPKPPDRRRKKKAGAEHVES